MKEGEDNFGEDFKKKSNAESTAASKAPEASSAGAVISPLPNQSSKFYCDLCKVGATCQEQLDMHYNGQKHKKKIKTTGIINSSNDASGNSEY